MGHIRLERISWNAGQFSLANVCLDIPAARYAILMGKTGCGKTTVAEIVCGLRKPSSGRVWIGERNVTRLPPSERGVGYVPQDGALFPTMTVAEQLGFALSIRHKPKPEIESTVKRLATELDVAHLLDRKPPGLSGGERQRVALGRALAGNPEVLILDEPLSALDEDTRDEIAVLLKRMQREFSVTALHITHSRNEAAQLADIVFSMDRGKISEVKTATTTEASG